MLCNFCGDPAAHPSTGAWYGPSTLSCAACTKRFWTWVRQHTAGRKQKNGKPWPSFYEAAGKWRK